MRYIALKKTSARWWHALLLIPGCALFMGSTVAFSFPHEILNGQSLVELYVALGGGFLIGIIVAFGAIGETQNLYFDTELKVMTYTEPLSFSSSNEMHLIGAPKRIVVETYNLPILRYHRKQVFLYIQCGTESSPQDYTIQFHSEFEARELAAKIAKISGAELTDR